MSKAQTLATTVSTGSVLADGTVAYAEVSGTPTLATVATTGAYADVTGTPTLPTFPSGTVVGTTDTQTLSGKTITNLINDGSITEEVYTLTGTAIDPTNGTIQVKALSAPVTFTDSVSAGQSVVLMLTGGDSNAITWPTMTWVTSGGNVAPTSTASDTFVLWKISTTLYGAYVGNYV